MFLCIRLEKDIRFNYFWTRCTKLISVSLKNRGKLCSFLEQQETYNAYLFMSGHTLCSTLCWMLQLPHCRTISWSKKNMDRSCVPKFQGSKPMEQIRDCSLLVNYNINNNRIWRLACWESKRNAVRCLLHALQLGIHILLDWKHDQPCGSLD